MRLLVCGGRDFIDRTFLRDRLDYVNQHFKLEVLIHGAAPGADRMAGEWARDNDIPEMPCYADWQRYRKLAGPMRNAKMLREATHVVAFAGGRGTEDMKWRARGARLPLWEPNFSCAPASFLR